MRIIKLITKGRMLWSYTKFSQLFRTEMHEDQSGEFLCGSWGLIFCLRDRFHGKLCLLFFSQLVANQFREVFRELQDRLKNKNKQDWLA